jgi:hypothetical protein
LSCGRKKGRRETCRPLLWNDLFVVEKLLFQLCFIDLKFEALHVFPASIIDGVEKRFGVLR